MCVYLVFISELGPDSRLKNAETKFHLLARGYTPYEDLKARLDLVLKEIEG